MTERELSITLREMARSQKKPLCDKWYAQWEDETDIDTLLDMYVRGFDFVQSNDFPSLDFIRKYFKTADLHRHHIYIDDTVGIDDAENGTYVFLGKCRAHILVKGFKAATIYCRHDSNVDVLVSDGARAFVTYYEKSTGECASDDMSKVITYNR